MTSASARGRGGREAGGGSGPREGGDEAQFVSICAGKTIVHRVGEGPETYRTTHRLKLLSGGFFKGVGKSDGERRMCMQRKCKHMYVEAAQSASRPLAVLCVSVCVSIHPPDTVSLPGFFFSFLFFCANSGFGNHLTSVTSCYVSPCRRAGEERGVREGAGGGGMSCGIFIIRHFFLSNLFYAFFSPNFHTNPPFPFSYYLYLCISISNVGMIFFCRC